MTTSTIPTTTSNVFGNSSTTTPSTPATSQANLNGQIAGNFTEFLQLLTTQLQNQNPLDPLDTNQFTQQLVEFASVEQEMNMNTNLQTLVSLQQTAQATEALNFVGQTVTVSGQTAPLTNSQAQWTFNPPSPASATFTITDSTGQTVFTQSGTVQPGSQQFNWNGLDNSGNQLPDGNYTLSITANDASGKSVAIPTTVTGVVNSVDLTQNPPTLSIGGQNYQLTQLLTVTQPLNAASNLTNAVNSAVTNALSGLGL